jgi:ABC-type transport system involved in multi-copper enzyme maturation permease subunit
MFTIVLWIAGHLVSDLRIWGIKEDNPLIHTAIKIGTFILPNLEIFNVRNRVMYGIDIGWGYTGWVAAYAGLSIIFFLGIASVIFTKRDFK